jgi:hypothetical protein
MVGMRAALLLFVSLQATLCVVTGVPAAARPGAAPQTWPSTQVQPSDELIYLTGPNGVYIYRRRPPFELVGFILVEAGDTIAGPALDAAQNVYVVNTNVTAQASEVDEYSRTRHGFKLVQRFLDADFGIALTVGADGYVYVVGNSGGVLEYAPTGGHPTLSINPPGVYVAADVAVDSQNDLFVAYQYMGESGVRRLARHHGRASNDPLEGDSTCSPGDRGLIVV